LSTLPFPVDGSSSGRAGSLGCHDAAARHDLQTEAKRARWDDEEQWL
jgi:hypothetical protein